MNTANKKFNIMRAVAAALVLALVLVTAAVSTPAPFAATDTDGRITVYLTLEKGLTVDGKTGKDDAAFGLSGAAVLGLENAFRFVGYKGELLPVPDPRAGYTFEGWGYSADALLYTTYVCPAENAVLHAVWHGDAAADTGPRAGFYLRFLGDGETPYDGLADSLDSRYNMALKSGGGKLEYAVFNVSLSAGQRFIFASHYPMSAAGGRRVYPSMNPVRAEKSQFTVGYTFYVGAGGECAKNYVFTQDGELEQLDSPARYTAEIAEQNAYLTVLNGADGVYNIYAVLYDGGGWLEVYMQKLS
ncbi:MAG: hypothetical protein LBP26_07665 [Clostridiales bacterium]|jgi:hypothetical protein|nr:hypothetical protein [Clostridiales bacterium]